MKRILKEFKLLEDFSGFTQGNVGFNAFPGPEPGRLHHGKIKVVRRYGYPHDSLRELIKRMRKKIPAHELYDGKSKTNRSKRTINTGAGSFWD